ncbi:MAG: hypothetical protein JNL58_13830 [Planctomyces sp.]|nr:hypothetical protein [Planctomyces sp.]
MWRNGDLSSAGSDVLIKNVIDTAKSPRSNGQLPATFPAFERLILRNPVSD